MNVIILGANGQLGSDVCSVLAQDSKLKVTPITRNEFDANIDLDNIATKLGKYTPNIIINCIAITNVDWCEDNSAIAFKINADFTYKLAKYCKQHDILLFHISTDYIYDGLNEFEYQEFDNAAPLNIYGLSKYAGDLAIQAYHNKYFILRVSGLFGKSGASGKGGNFITTIKRLAIEKDEIKVIADQVSNPTSTLAVARCIAHFISHNITEYGVFNCVSNDVISWYDFAREILRLSNLDENKIKPIEFKDYKFIAKRPQNSTLAVNKLKEFYSMPSIRESLAEYLNKL